MADLKKRIADILKASDFQTTTAKKVRNKLEEDTGLDLSLKIEEISRIMQEVMDETAEVMDEIPEEKGVLESGVEGSEEVCLSLRRDHLFSCRRIVIQSNNMTTKF